MTGSNHPHRLKLLAVDDEPEHLDLIRAALAKEAVDVSVAPTAEVGLDIFKAIHPSIVISDIALPGMGGLEFLQELLVLDPAVDVILITGFYSTESAVDAIRKGACDYFSKPLDVALLSQRVRALIEEAAVRHRARVLDQKLVDAFQFQGMIGRSPLMLEVFAKLRRIAPHFRTVLVRGETGTGKELVARALHNLSPVSKGRLAVCNCSALVDTLLESQLFGYVRGAFTGASEDKEGVFEYASGGSVFLDEIGELSLSAQAKLLRVVQNQEVQRVGSPVPHQIDVRIVAATHRDLKKMIGEGKFREDLYYRLSVIELTMPRLSERKEDLPLLQHHFLEKYSALYRKRIRGITRRAQLRLANHSWPGNIRELENVVSGACIMTTEDVIDLQDLPDSFLNSTLENENTVDQLLSLEAVQRQHVNRVLQHVGGNKVRAAEILGVGRSTLYDILNRIEKGTPGAPPTAGREQAQRVVAKE